MKESLETELDRLEAWRMANIDKIGTEEFTRSTIAHRLLTDLIAIGGGSSDQRAEVALQLSS